MDCALSSVSSHLLGGEAYVPRKNEPTTQTAAQPSVMPAQSQTQPSTMYTQVPNYPSVMPSQPPGAILHDAQCARCGGARGTVATAPGLVPSRLRCGQICFHPREKDVDCLFKQQSTMVHKLRVVLGGVVDELQIAVVGLVDHLLHSLHLLFHLGHLRLQLLPLLLHLADFLR